MWFRIGAGAAFVGLAVYPFLLLLTIDMSSVLPIALLALLGTARVACARDMRPPLRLVIGAALFAFCGLAWFGSDLGLVKLYPVVVSLAALTYALWTLAHPPSAAERFAKTWNPTERFDERKRTYTRHVTQVWAGFFLVNGAIASYTAFATSTQTWALYNGLISYLIIGVLFGGEHLLRLAVRRRYHSGAQSAS